MDFDSLKMLVLGASIGFAQTTLGMLKVEDWGKLDFCEYIQILLKQIHVLIICLLGYVILTASLFTILSGFINESLLFNSLGPKSKYGLILIGYIPSMILSWFMMVRRLRRPISGIDIVIIKWREIFIEHVRDQLKLRLIQLHCRLHVSEDIMKEKLRSFYEQHKNQIAKDLNSEKARRVHPDDYALMTRYLMEWQGYYETARLLGEKGVLSNLRPILCPIGTLGLLILLIYFLYSFGFFNL